MGKASKRFIFPVFLCFVYLPFLYAQEITFAKDVAPIIFHKCTPCHSPGQIGPMPLTNYQEVASYATMIGYVTRVGYMPPWRASSKAHSLKGENTLSAEELQTLQQWIAAGFPEGDPELLPPLPSIQQVAAMSQPDLILSMSEAFEQYGVYYDQYRVFVLPTNLAEDQMVSAIEFVPGESSLVRGAFLSIDTGEEVSQLDDWDPQYGYFSFGEIGLVPEESHWYSWHPGKGMTQFREGQGLYLPKGAKLLLHLHYGPTGVPQKDSSHINLQFAQTAQTKQVFSAPLIHPYSMTNDTFYIPAGQTTRYHASFSVPFDLELHGLFPHSHLLGKTWEIFTVGPDRGASQSLLKIEDWDFNWKQLYEFEAPIILTKGTTVHALAAYDNSSDNPLNPSDPPRSMTWGKRMFEEMFLVFFSLSEYQSADQQKNSFQLLPGPTNAKRTKPLELKFQNQKRQKFTCRVNNFSGAVQQVLFEEKEFGKGVHQLSLDLQKLDWGNYYLELESKDQIDRHLFVLMAADLFD